jgi:iron(III) transport system permease protein
VDARTWTLLLNTLWLAAATCAISLPLGTVLAWLLARTDLPGRRIGIVLLVVMLFVPLYLQAAAWQAGFGLQGWFTLAGRQPALLEGPSGAVWVHAMAAVPWVVLIVGLALRRIEPELEEQALLDGSAWQVFARVTLPGVSGAIALAALWVGIMTAGEIAVTDLFTVRTYAEELYTSVALGRPALGVLPGVVLSALLVAAGLWIAARLAPKDRPPSFRRPWVYQLGRYRVPIAVAAAVVLLLLVGVPLGSLCYKAGVLVTQTDTGRLRVWSPEKFLRIVACSPWQYRREFGWSLGISSLAAAGAVVAAEWRRSAWPGPPGAAGGGQCRR